ncbi:MAG TPA: serine/threonine-protein kinase, partial [Pyrinomonadaceae bacterium]|nr:serine/threonine-protein kinase [Pyrinomonadaceae bacterium]
MKPERWQQISRIFKSAISLDGVARAEYVKEKCGADADLQQEVEKLIESHQKAEDNDFIAGLAVEDIAEHFSGGEETHALHKGEHLGAYLILDHLGTGGMGEVYLARDSRLDRTVALKILAPEVAADTRRMQRFRQEAKVTSSLNQPNILTIFEFGQEGEMTFLAAEFVDGETLREHLRAKRLKLSEILDIGIQILAALDAAHEANIVHRDIKPENVMIRRRDHVVKVLDFGLAKVTEKGKGSFNSGATLSELKTAPGLIMGTVNYMSPEQAQAKSVDARSDIWSTGVMLYEMVAGTNPFGGNTSAHTIVEILEKEPAPLARAGGAEVPAELQRIVSKSIAKNPEERYQTAKDMLIDLRNLKKRLELDAEIQRSAPFGQSGMAPIESPQSSAQGNRRLIVAMVAIVAVVAGVFAINGWRKVQNRMGGPPVSTNVPAAPAPVARTLTYWITVQKFKDDRVFQEPFDLAGEINFEANYRIRLNVRSDQAGYFYVLNEGPAGDAEELQYVAVFPSPTANNGSEVLAASQSIRIPDQSWLRFDEEQGVEKLWLVFSEQPVPELDGIKAFASGRTRGLITDPAVNQTVKGFLNS